jgi:ATPase
VDTVIFIKKGQIETVYNVNFVVKVPAGMTEADLARPVIEVSNFETEKLEYEIYLFSRQIVVMPVRKAEKPETKHVWKFAAKEIEREVGKYAKDVLRVEMLSDNRAKVYVSDRDISHVIGKGGKTIEKIEEALGIDLDIELIAEKPRKEHGVETSQLTDSLAEVEFTDRHVVITSDASAGDIVDVLIDNEYLFTATMGRGGEIKVTKGTNIANRIINAIDLGERIMIRKT